MTYEEGGENGQHAHKILFIDSRVRKKRWLWETYEKRQTEIFSLNH